MNVRLWLVLLGLTVTGSGAATAQSTTIRPGAPALDPTRLRLGTDTIHLRWEMDGTERPGPEQIEELAVEWNDGRKVLRQVMTVVSDTSTLVSDTTWYRFDTLHPLSHHSHSRQRTLVLEYGPDSLAGLIQSADGESLTVAAAIPDPVFDPSASVLVLRSLALRRGMEVRIPLYNHETHEIRWMSAQVEDTTTIEVGGAPVPAWLLRVDLGIEGRQPVKYWIGQRDQRLLRVEVPVGNGRFMRGSVSGPAEPADLGALIRRGIEALGGEEALRAIHSASVGEIGHIYLIEQSERPAGPWIPMYVEREGILDFSGRQVRRTTRSRLVQAAGWTPWFTIIADTGAAAFIRGEQQAPWRPPEVLEASWDTELNPLRLWFTIQRATDARISGDTVVQDVPHTIVTFTWRNRPARVLVNASTSLPTAVAVRAPSLHGHGSVWGDAWVSRWFSLWSMETGGIRFPRQRDTYFAHYPWKSFTVTRAEFNVATPPDSFRITPETRTAFTASLKRGGLREMQLGQQFGGKTAEAIELPGGIVVLPGAWNVTLIPQDDGVFVLEAPISPEYSVQVMEEVHSRFPGLPIKAAISTSDAWPHVGGVRGYVAAGVPVYALDANVALLERLVQQPWTGAPDSLALSPRAPIFHAVNRKTVIGSGEKTIELYPIRTESGERMMMVYWPAHLLLYAADLIQQMPDGSFFWPLYLREVMDAVERHGLEVTTVFAMHTGPTPWSDVIEAVRAAWSTP